MWETAGAGSRGGEGVQSTPSLLGSIVSIAGKALVSKNNVSMMDTSILLPHWGHGVATVCLLQIWEVDREFWGMFVPEKWF